MKPDAILIAGPTASGKSALAVRLARHVGGVVLNADALQVYDGLRILTARPTALEMEGIEHRLYGHVQPDRPYSVADWRGEVRQLLAELTPGRIPVFCGGTGLYFRALIEGIDEMPEIPAEVRERWRREAGARPGDDLHRILGERDPEAAARLRPTDKQRIVRALELGEASGRRLADLQQGRGRAVFDLARTRAIVLTPDRALLRERIASRFAAMMSEGAAEEAQNFARRYGSNAPLAGQAIGLRELTDVTHGGMTVEAAIERAVTRSRQYAKRQETWFRNQFDDRWQRYADPLDVPFD